MKFYWKKPHFDVYVSNMIFWRRPLFVVLLNRDAPHSASWFNWWKEAMGEKCIFQCSGKSLSVSKYLAYFATLSKSEYLKSTQNPDTILSTQESEFYVYDHHLIISPINKFYYRRQWQAKYTSLLLSVIQADSFFYSVKFCMKMV